MKSNPIRMCSGCHERKEKHELIRVVRSKEGEISLDERGKKPGRGVYICKNADCLKKARKAKRFERSFESEIPSEVYETLEKELLNIG